MTAALFVRIRGRVLGPFDQDKLRSLAARGQFGRMHEVSEDGVSWARASLYPELFKAEESRGATIAVSDTVATSGNRAVASDSASAPQAASPEAALQSGGFWHYEAGGNQVGPVTFGQLRALFSNGELRATDRVWKQGWSHWRTASDVEGLLPEAMTHVASAVPSFGAAKSGDQLFSSHLVSQLAETRPWIIMFAVLSALSATALLVSGVVFLIMAAKASSLTAVASAFATYSIMSFIQGCVSGFTAYLLFVYVGRIRDFSYHRNDQTLALALRTSKQLIVFWGVLTLIGLVFGAIVTVYALAVA